MNIKKTPFYTTGKDCIDCLLADREFVGKDWLAFLNQNNIRYYIRIRNNFKIFCPKRQQEIRAWHLSNNLKNGELKYYNRIFKMHEEYGYLSGMKIIKDGKNRLLYCVLIQQTRRSYGKLQKKDGNCEAHHEFRKKINKK